MGRKPTIKQKALLTAEATQTVGLAGLALACEALMLIGGIFVVLGMSLALGCCCVVIILHWQEMWAAIRTRRFSRHSILPLAVVVVIPTLGALVANKDAILSKTMPAAHVINPSPPGIITATGLRLTLSEMELLAKANATPAPAARLSSVLIECHDSAIPNVALAPKAHAYILILPNKLGSAPQLVDYSSPTGGALPLNKDNEIADGYVCTITNYSKKPLASLAIGIQSQLWNTKAEGKGGFRRVDPSSLVFSGMRLDSIDSGESDKFTFYIWNQGSLLQNITFSERGVAIDVISGSSKQINVVETSPVTSLPRWYYSRF